MFTQSIFWLWFAGLIFLTAGLAMARRELVTARGLEKLIVLGPVFAGSPLAVFGAEHFVDARFIAQMVPVWVPAHLFWTYFVGVALIAAASSMVAKKFVRLSATLLGLMFLLFVLMLHLPFVIAQPGNRLAWTIALRETAFAGGAWALAGSQSLEVRRNWMILIGRFSMAGAPIFFGVEQLLHPEFAPGVPGARLTPGWVPFHAFWGYPVGAFLLLAGIALLLNQRPRIAAAGIGVLMLLLTLFLFLPFLGLTAHASEMTDAINYVADTLMFSGTALLLAKALSTGKELSAP